LAEDEGEFGLIRVGEGDEGVTEVDLVGLPLHKDELVVVLLGQQSLVQELVDLALGVIEREGEGGGAFRVKRLSEQLLVTLTLGTDEGVIWLKFFSKVLTLKFIKRESPLIAHGVRKQSLLSLKCLSSFNDSID
jgi:hypothetical protein